MTKKKLIILLLNRIISYLCIQLYSKTHENDLGINENILNFFD